VCFARGYVTRWMQTLMQRERVGSGPMDKEADALNREIFNEYLEVVIKAWTQDTFNHSGKHYQAPFPATGIANWPVAEWTRQFGGDGEVDDQNVIHRIGVVPKPVTQPHPDIWIPYTHSYDTLLWAAQRDVTTIIYDGEPERFRKACEHFRSLAAEAGIERKLGQGIAPLRKIYIADTFEEAFEKAVNTSGYWFNNYFSLWGVNEQMRIPSDDPSKFVTFSSDRECAQRMYDQGQLICGTVDDVSRRLESLSRCHADGEIDWLLWEYWVAPNTTGDEQLEQLHLFMDKVWPRFK
jgi:alkanesulfonate monooxygenase SsuD/methylene tetrahydromethanopterin reductase-like flavin-dependent oxidoreductase (luciferase family)